MPSLNNGIVVTGAFTWCRNRALSLWTFWGPRTLSPRTHPSAPVPVPVPVPATVRAPDCTPTLPLPILLPLLDSLSLTFSFKISASLFPFPMIPTIPRPILLVDRSPFLPFLPHFEDDGCVFFLSLSSFSLISMTFPFKCGGGGGNRLQIWSLWDNFLSLSMYK